MADVVSYRNIKAAELCKYDSVSLGEVMLRLDPRDVPTARARDSIRVSQGGGETNVSCGISYTFGMRAAILTGLVKDAIGDNIQNQLRELGVDTSLINWWNTESDGTRFSTDKKGTLSNGIAFTYVGSGLLPSNTTYYRGHSAATELAPGDVDFDKLFGVDGVRVFSTGGIFTLIGERTSELAIEAAMKASEYGTLVAADLNYRAKVEPNKDRARAINRELAPYIGFLVGNDSDLSDALGYDMKPVAKEAPFEEWLEAYKECVLRVAEDFPNLSLIGTQWRGAHNADLISWGAVLFDPKAETWHVAPIREDVPIRDRTGGGDSFAAGVLAGLMQGKDLDAAVNFGAAHGILVQETPGDVTMVNQYNVENEVSRALSGGGVKATR